MNQSGRRMLTRSSESGWMAGKPGDEGALDMTGP